MKVTEGDKRVVDVFVSVIGLVGLVVGGIWGLWQYEVQSHRERLSRTMEYVNRYNVPPLTEVRHEALLGIRAVSFEADKIGESSSSGASKKVAMADLILEAIYCHDKLRYDVDQLLDYFEELSNCAGGGVCDAEYVKTMRGEDARNLLQFAHAYVCVERSYWRERPTAFDVEGFFEGPGALDCELSAAEAEKVQTACVSDNGTGDTER